MFVSMLLYVDDVALLAPDEQSLQLMLNCLNVWCKKWRLQLNQSKTKVIHFRNPSVSRSASNFTCGDLDALCTDRYRYLGLWFTENLDMSLTAQELSKSAGRALGALYTKFILDGGMSCSIFKTLYESLVEPVLFYGAGIWGVNIYRFTQTIQNKACRLFLGTGKNASNIATFGDLGLNSCMVKQRLEVSRLWLRLHSSDPNRLVYIITQMVTVSTQELGK